MFNSPARLIVAILAFVIGISVVAGWFYCQEPQKVIVELPNSKWEQIFFKLINKATELGGLEKLRESNLNKDDVEVRVWRGFGLGDLEGVVLKRTNSEWKAFHVKADD